MEFKQPVETVPAQKIASQGEDEDKLFSHLQNMSIKGDSSQTAALVEKGLLESNFVGRAKSPTKDLEEMKTIKHDSSRLITSNLSCFPTTFGSCSFSLKKDLGSTATHSFKREETPLKPAGRPSLSNSSCSSNQCSGVEISMSFSSSCSLADSRHLKSRSSSGSGCLNEDGFYFQDPCSESVSSKKDDDERECLDQESKFSFEILIDSVKQVFGKDETFTIMNGKDCTIDHSCICDDFTAFRSYKRNNLAFTRHKRSGSCSFSCGIEAQSRSKSTSPFTSSLKLEAPEIASTNPSFQI